MDTSAREDTCLQVVPTWARQSCLTSQLAVLGVPLAIRKPRVLCTLTFGIFLVEIRLVLLR